MKIGKVSESVLKRSILKQIKTTRDEVLSGAGIGEDCAILALKEDEAVAVCTDPISCTFQNAGRLAVHNVANDLAAAGAEPLGVMITLLIPDKMRESSVKDLMIEIEDTCQELHMQVLGGHTEVTRAVNQLIVSASGIGKLKRQQAQKGKNITPGQDIVITKWIGLEGTALLAKEKEPELLTRFPVYLIEEAKRFAQYHSILPEAATAIRSGVGGMHDVTEGGVFGALWQIAESAGVGLEVNLKKLPVKQETIEICEFFELNPYELLSGGALLIVTDHGFDLVKALEKDGIAAAVVGKITAGNDRVVMNEEEKRFLEPPKSDELYKVL